MTIREIIRSAIRHSGLTREAVAHRMGYENRQAIEQIMSRKDLRVSTLMRLGKATGFHLEVVFGDGKTLHLDGSSEPDLDAFDFDTSGVEQLLNGKNGKSSEKD